MAVSRSVGSTPATVADLLDYERVVAALHANRTVVPLRYSVVENESTVVQLLAGRQREFRELLIRLEGKTELGVRILVKGQPGGTAPAPDSGSSSPGAAYVARIRQRLYSHAPNEAEQDILDRMSRLIAHIENVQLGESSLCRRWAPVVAVLSRVQDGCGRLPPLSTPISSRSTFEIPVNRSLASVQLCYFARFRMFRSAVILNIHEDDECRNFLTNTLVSNGFRVWESGSITAALELARNGPDLVLLGASAAFQAQAAFSEVLKATNRTESTPVLAFLPSEISDREIAQALEGGVHGVLRATAGPLELVATIRTHLRLRREKENLQATNLRWDATFDAIPVGICLVDEEGTLLRWNRAVGALFKKDHSVQAGRSWTDPLDAEARQPLNTLLSKALSTHQRQEIDLPYGPAWFHASADPVVDPAAAPIGAIVVLSDITRQKAAEQALCDCEANYRSIFDSSPHAIWVYDKETLGVLDVNKVAVRDYGYSRHEFLSRTVDRLYPENEFSAVQKKIEQGSSEIPCRHVKRDGASIIVDTIPQPISFRGRPSVLMRSIDVTASKRSELLYRILVDNIPPSVLLIDESMNVVLANQHFLDKSRRSRQETLGKPLSKALPAVILEELALLSQIRQVFQSGTALQGQRLTYRAPGIALRTYYYSLVPIPWASHVEHVLLVMDDVTEQIRLGEEIRRVEHHLASVVESANEIVLSTGLTGEILSWNSAAERLTGYSPDEVQGKDLPTLLGAESLPQYQALFSSIQRENTTHNLECEVITKNGVPIPVSWVLSPLTDGSGAAVGIVAVGRDLTEQRRFEQQIRQAEKLAALGVMAGAFAHEVRTPLAIASSAAQFLMEQDISENFRRECAEKVHLGMQRASKVIENVLRFAHPSSTEKTFINLISVFRDAVVMIPNQARVNRVEIVSRVPSGPVHVLGSASLLEQIFLNLFLNALKAMPNGGTLTISIEQVEAEAVIKRIRYRVRHSGCRHQSRVRPVLYDSASRRRHGTGSLHLLLDHKTTPGSIAVESVPGQGSTITVRLPLAKVLHVS